MIETQLRRADGHVPKPATIVAAGERYVIRRPARPEPPCPRMFAVLYEDARLRVIDKPAGLPVHASAKFYFNTLTRVLSERYPDEPELQICHRLDRETSGLPRGRARPRRRRDAQGRVRAQGRGHQGVPRDRPRPAAVGRRATTIDSRSGVSRPGDADAAAPRAHADRPRRRCRRSRGSGSSSARPTHALVRCTLVTGRQHQIRAHLAAAGFPIVGDKLYAHGDDAFIRTATRGCRPTSRRCSCCRATRCTRRGSRSRTPTAVRSRWSRRCRATWRCGDQRRPATSHGVPSMIAMTSSGPAGNRGSTNRSPVRVPPSSIGVGSSSRT